MDDSNTGDREPHDAEDEASDSATRSRVDELLEGAAAGEDDDRLDAGDRKMLANVTAKVLGITASQVRIGRFCVQRELGQGAMGKVYAALDPHLGRIIALKVHTSAEPSERERRRMLQEARILAQFKHDNVVRVYEAGEHRGQVFVAMELVEGRTLREIQDERPSRSWRDLVSLYLMAGRGLQAAHTEQIVHRDFKPSNVLIDDDGRAQVLDFGLARDLASGARGTSVMSETVPDEPGAIERVLSPMATPSNEMWGTPAYMAPELFGRAGRATARSDQFSFCVALYEALYGQRPFEGKTAKELAEAMHEGELRPPPKGSSVPSWLFGILRKGLSVAPEDRHPSMEVLLQEIEHHLASRWKPWLVSFLSVGVAAALGASVLYTPEQTPCTDRRIEITERWSQVRPSVSSKASSDVSLGVVDEAVERFAEADEAFCLAAGSRQAICQARIERDYEQLLVRASEQTPRATSFSRLVEDYVACLEEQPSLACEGPGEFSEAAGILSEARSDLGFGNHEDALVKARRALHLAEQEQDQITPVHAWLLIGQIQSERAESREARKAFEHALAGATTCSAPALVIDAALGRVEVEVRHVGTSKKESVEYFLETAERVLKQRDEGELPLRRARLEEKKGSVALLFSRECSLAMTHYGRALELRKGHLEDLERQQQPSMVARIGVADAQMNLGRAMSMCDPDDQEGAIALLQQALEGLTGTGAHPQQGTYEHNLGIALVRARRYEQAENHLLSALGTYAEFGGRYSLDRGSVHVSLANLYRRTDRREEALEQAKANLEIHRRAEYSTPLAHAIAIDTVGSMATALARFAEAQALHREAIDYLETLMTSRKLDVEEARQLSVSYANEAIALCGSKQRAASAKSFQQAQPHHPNGSRAKELERVQGFLVDHDCWPPE